MHKRRPKIFTCLRVSKAKCYLYHSTKIAKARPGFDNWPEHPSVQINYSSPWTSLMKQQLFKPVLFLLQKTAARKKYCFAHRWRRKCLFSKLR